MFDQDDCFAFVIGLMILLGAWAIRGVDSDAMNRAADAHYAAQVNELETERENLRDACIGGNVVRYTGVAEADRLFNRTYTRWFPDKAYQLFHSPYYREVRHGR